MAVFPLGLFDGEQTVARRADAVIAALDQKDWLPGMQVAQQGLEYAYTGGAECEIIDVSGKSSKILR